MALGIVDIVAHDRVRDRAYTLRQTVDAAGQVTDRQRFSGAIAVQIYGTATAISVQIERTVNGGNDWSPVDTPISGNPSTGMSVQGFSEPAVAGWRARVISITGTATVSLSGGAGA